MSAFIPPDGSINPIFRTYLVENNEGQLLTRAETMSQRRKRNQFPCVSLMTGALSTLLTLSVPCRPMTMVSSVAQVAAYQDCSHPASVCLVDHVLHADCPDVGTLGSQRRTVAYYTKGE